MVRLTCVTATFNCVSAGNRERLIRCVESVAKLKTEHEHLIYDGASTDGTVELLHELAAKTPGLKVVSEPDTGIYNALNKGVRDAKGDWFYVLGADDYICCPNVMDKMLECVLSSEEVIHSPICVPNGVRPRNWTNALRHFFLYNSIPHQGTIILTSIIRKFGGFDARNKVSADYDLFFKVHKAGHNIRYTSDAYAYYHTRGLSSDDLLCEYYDKMVLQFHLCLSERQYTARRRASIPLMRSIPFLFHHDLALRLSSRYMVVARFKWFLYGWIRCIKWLEPLRTLYRRILRHGEFA